MLKNLERPIVAGPIRHSRPWITDSDVAATFQVLASGMLVKGRLTERFEKQVAAKCNLATSRFVASGRAALAKALQLADVVAGDEVLIPTYVCHSVRDAVQTLGAIPIFCDVSRDWCLDPVDAAARLTPRTRAIVVAHMFGIAADVDALRRLGLPVIEDCAQAFGGQTADGRQLGSIGAAAIYSLQPTKPLTTGAGGIIGSADELIAGRLQSASSDPSWDAAAPVTDLAAALGISQLARYDQALRRRRVIAERYTAGMTGLNTEIPADIADRSMYFRFPVRIRIPVETVMTAFAERGVLVRRGVDTLLHRVAGLDREDFPGAEECFNTTVSLPIYPSLTDEEAETVIVAAHDVLKAAA